MNLKLDNKVALVTGSTLGLGFATVKKLCEENCTVYLNGRSQESVDNAVGKLTRLTSVRTSDLKSLNKLAETLAKNNSIFLIFIFNMFYKIIHQTIVKYFL